MLHVGLAGSYQADLIVVSATSLIILILLVVLLIGVVPSWPHSRRWGYAPSGTLGTVLLIVLILAVLRYI